MQFRSRFAIKPTRVAARVKQQKGAWERRLRPSEIVSSYLEREAARHELTDGSRIPPIRQVATELSVSMRTVQSVFQKLVREGRIRTKAGDGTFWVAPSRRTRDVLDIALGIHATTGAPDEEWTHRISGGVLRAASEGTPRVRLLPLHYRLEDPAALEELLKERHAVDGLILFPFAANHEVRRAYAANGKPVVDLNPPSDTAVTDFVAPDYFGASRRIGMAWKETGRKRVLLMLHAPLERSVSNRVRLAGLVNGLGTGLGRDIHLQMVVAESAHQDHAHRAMQKFLATAEARADAVYCVGDAQAAGVLRAVSEIGLRVPEDVSVVGGTGLDFPAGTHPSLTRTKQPLHELGETLVAVLRQRIQENRAVPAVILETPFIGGATTRPQENLILGIEK